MNRLVRVALAKASGLTLPACTFSRSELVTKEGCLTRDDDEGSGQSKATSWLQAANNLSQTRARPVPHRSVSILCRVAAKADALRCCVALACQCLRNFTSSTEEELTSSLAPFAIPTHYTCHISYLGRVALAKASGLTLPTCIFNPSELVTKEGMSHQGRR